METKLYNGEVNLRLDGLHQYWVTDGDEERKVIGVTSVSGLLDKSGPLKFWAVNLACNHLLEIMDQGVEIEYKDIEEARQKHTQRLKEAADTGTKVHAFAEAVIRAQIEGTPMPEKPSKDDEAVFKGAIAFLRWISEHDVRFVSTERLVYSREHGYGGLMDAEAVIDGKRRVIDFKTSSAKKPKTKKVKGEEVAIPCKMCGSAECGGVYDEYRFQTAAYRAAAEAEGSVYDADRMIVHFDKQTGHFSVHELDNYEADLSAFVGLLAAKKRVVELT